MKGIILSTLLSLIAVASVADESACAQSVQAQKYMVSGLLRKGSEGMTVKIAHSVEVTSSADEAANSFAGKIQQMYPGYSVLSTLTSPVQCVDAPSIPFVGAQQLCL